MATKDKAFTVKTNHGWGWRVLGAPECPSFGNQAAAQRYADLRTQGVPHRQAWDTAEADREGEHHV